MSKKTGGTAFPTQSSLGLNDASTWITEIPGQPGMTLRDYFAAKAMAVVMPAVVDTLRSQTLSQEKTDQLKIGAAAACYGMADAMLKVRAE